MSSPISSLHRYSFETTDMSDSNIDCGPTQRLPFGSSPPFEANDRLGSTLEPHKQFTNCLSNKENQPALSMHTSQDESKPFYQKQQTSPSQFPPKKSQGPKKAIPLSPQEFNKGMNNILATISATPAISAISTQVNQQKKSKRSLDSDSDNSADSDSDSALIPESPTKKAQTEQRTQAAVPPTPRRPFSTRKCTNSTAETPPSVEYDWDSLSLRGPTTRNWNFNNTTYQVTLLGKGDFHKVYKFNVNTTITVQINTRISSSPLTWQSLSLKTENVVLRILNPKSDEACPDYNSRLKELQADNAIDLHCLRENIPLVKKIVTSFVPEGHPLPSDYITPQGTRPVIGWELCQLVNTDCIVPLCEAMRITPLTNLTRNASIVPPSKEHLFDWLLTEWKAYVAYMVKTQSETGSAQLRDFEEKSPAPSDLPPLNRSSIPAANQQTRKPKRLGESSKLGYPRVGDFRPHNIGYDEEQKTFVYTDLKMEETAADYLNESLSGFLGKPEATSSLRKEVVDNLIEYARSIGAPQDFLEGFKNNIFI